jgi:hypothetical protein
MEGTAVKKMAQKKKHCSRRVRNQRRICLGRLWRYFITISFVGKPEGKRPLGRPRRKWEDNIKMDVQEVGGGRGVLD